MPHKGYKLSEEQRKNLIEARKGKGVGFQKGHKINLGRHRYGEEAPNWKGGRKKNNRGYVFILLPEHSNSDRNGYIYEHRTIMEKEIGRYLTKEEVVHHINGIKDDNKIENLMLFANDSEHTKYHKRQGG